MIDENATCQMVYHCVYERLPEDIRPMRIWQMTLMRMTVDGEYEEVLNTKERASVMEGEILYVITETTYVEAGRGNDYNAYHDDDKVSDGDDYVYQMMTLEVLSDKGENSIRDYILYHPNTNVYYLVKDVEGNWTGRYRDEFSFHFKKGSIEYKSLEEVIDAWLSMSNRYSRQTKEHLKSGWMELFDPVDDEWEDTVSAEDWNSIGKEWREFRYNVRHG